MPPVSLKNASLSPAAADLGIGQTTDALTSALQEDELLKKKKQIVAASGGIDSPAAMALLGSGTGGFNV